MSGTNLTSFSAPITFTEDIIHAEDQEEREWQRQTAIFVVFILFFIILIIVMAIIHGGIHEQGLILSVHTVTVNTSDDKR